MRRVIYTWTRSEHTRPGMIKFLIVLTLAAIVRASAPACLPGQGRGQSSAMVNAAHPAIALSVALFILLFIAWKGGMIPAHGVAR